MKSIRNNKGFSLVELIVVVAIMAVLVGVTAPAMTRYIEKSRESTDLMNVRAAFSEVTAAVTTEDRTATYGKDNSPIYQNDDLYMIEVPLKQLGSGWSSAFETLSIGGVSYADIHWINEPQAKGTCKVYYRDGEMFIDWGGEAVVYDNSNSIAKYVLNHVQQDLATFIASNASNYQAIFSASKLNTHIKTAVVLPDGKSVDLYIYNRDYDNYQDTASRMVANTASVIYNSSTGNVSTIIYYDGKDYTSWSLTDDQWQDNAYITKKS